MKKKKINDGAALLEVARRHHTTVEEVRKEIRLAMIAAMCNPDPAVQKRWREIPHTGDISRRKISLHTLQSSACHNDLTLWS